VPRGLHAGAAPGAEGAYPLGIAGGNPTRWCGGVADQTSAPIFGVLALSRESNYLTFGDGADRYLTNRR